MSVCECFSDITKCFPVICKTSNRYQHEFQFFDLCDVINEMLPEHLVDMDLVDTSDFEVSRILRTNIEKFGREVNVRCQRFYIRRIDYQ